MTKFAICSCYYRSNIFIRSLGQHIHNYSNETDFRQEFPSVNNQVIQEIQNEIERRKNVWGKYSERKLILQRNYKPKFFDYFFKLDSSQHLRSEFLSNNADFKKINETIITFPFFTSDFCRKLIEEIQNLCRHDLPIDRPNTMNKGGVLLNPVMNFENYFMNLIQEKLQPLINQIYGRDIPIDSHRTFIVKYKVGEDVDLSSHFDNSEITLNVSLNDQFNDGELVFQNPSSSSSSINIGIEHRLGTGILHPGNLIHQALPITEGERWNLIIWMRSSKIRNKLCPMCNAIPDKIPLQDGIMGDGFTMENETASCTVN